MMVVVLGCGYGHEKAHAPLKAHELSVMMVVVVECP